MAVRGTEGDHEGKPPRTMGGRIPKERECLSEKLGKQDQPTQPWLSESKRLIVSGKLLYKNRNSLKDFERGGLSCCLSSQGGWSTTCAVVRRERIGKENVKQIFKIFVHFSQRS